MNEVTSILGIAGDTSSWSSSAEAFAAIPELDVTRAWKRLFQSLNELRALARDWDGDDSLAPDSALLATAADFLVKMKNSSKPPPVRVLPTQSGGVLVEWQSPGHYLEAEIIAVDVIELMEKIDDQPAIHWELCGPILNFSQDSPLIDYDGENPWLNVTAA
jgi:hypothetical protein